MSYTLRQPATALRCLLAIVLLLFFGCVERPDDSATGDDTGISPSESSPAPAIFPHPDGWENPASHGSWVVQNDSTTCLECHQVSSSKVETTPTCNSCHLLYPHDSDWSKKEKHAASFLASGRPACATQCHGSDLEGGLSGISCTLCHTTYPHPADWVAPSEHGMAAKGPGKSACQSCHGADLMGGDSGVSCKKCHANYPHSTDWEQPDQHGAFVSANGSSSCASLCHGTDLKGGLSGIGCNSCHTVYPHAPTWDANHGAITLTLGTSVCKPCHGDNFRAMVDGKNCYSCHHDYPHPAPTSWLPFTGGHGQRVNSVYAGSTSTCQPCHGTDLKKIKPDSKNCFSCHLTYPHDQFSSADWGTYEGHGQYALPLSKRPECQTCHGTDYKGGARSNPSCFSCHSSYPHLQVGWLRSPGQPQEHGNFVVANSSNSCATAHCHGKNLVPTPGVTNGPGCDSCHTNYPHPTGWNAGTLHGPVALANISACKYCHGTGLDGAPAGYQSCLQCHPSYLRHESAELGSTNWDAYVGHGAFLKLKAWNTTECKVCHGDNYLGGISHISCKGCHASFPHDASGWDTGTGHGNHVKTTLGGNLTSCKVCHGNDLKGGHSGVSCNTCHMNYPHSVISGWGSTGHGPKADTSTESDTCKTCHGTDFLGGTSGISCKSCHASFPHDAPGWSDGPGHGGFVETTLSGDVTSCKLCHGSDLKGGISGVSCDSCHPNFPHSIIPNWATTAHGPTADAPAKRDSCKACHGTDLLGGSSGISCKSCHASFPHDTPGWSTGTGHGNFVETTLSGNVTSCKLCHGNDLKGGISGVSCDSCHPNFPHSIIPNWATTAHGPTADAPAKRDSCKACHGTDLLGGTSGISCKSCHTEFPHAPGWVAKQTEMAPVSTTCCDPEDEYDCWPCTVSTPVDRMFLHGQKFVEQKAGGFVNTPNRCSNCHGADYSKVMDGKSCMTCHNDYPHVKYPKWVDLPSATPLGGRHTVSFLSGPIDPTSSCTACHVNFGAGVEPIGLATAKAPACSTCHGSYPHPHIVASPDSWIYRDVLPYGYSEWRYNHGWASIIDSYNEAHGGDPSLCKACHGAAGSGSPSCNTCHVTGAVSHAVPGWSPSNGHGINFIRAKLASYPAGTPDRCHDCHPTAANRGPKVCNPFTASFPGSASNWCSECHIGTCPCPGMNPTTGECP